MLMVATAKLVWVSIEDQPQVMVAHIVKVPPRAKVARRTLLPCGVMHSRGEATGHVLKRSATGNIGKSQTLGRKYKV